VPDSNECAHNIFFGIANIEKAIEIFDFFSFLFPAQAFTVGDFSCAMAMVWENFPKFADSNLQLLA
jgi:hypothetical protein